MHAAQGAALVAKVARDSGVVSSPERADELRETALTLAAGDAEGTGPAGPGRFSTEVIAVAAQILTLAEAIRPVARRTAVADLAAAAEAVRAAAGTARVDVEVDLVGTTDPAARERLLTAIEPVDDLVLRAAKLTAVVREQILR